MDDDCPEVADGLEVDDARAAGKGDLDANMAMIYMLCMGGREERRGEVLMGVEGCFYG